MVLMSIHVPPAASPSRMLCSPATVAVTASGEGRQVMTVSETHAVSAAGPAQEAPASRSAVAASLLMSCTVIGKPARSRLPARRRPRLPDAQSRHEKTITSLLPALAGAT